MNAVQMSEFYQNRDRKEYAAKELYNRAIAPIVKHETIKRMCEPLIFEIPKGFSLPRN